MSNVFDLSYCSQSDVIIFSGANAAIPLKIISYTNNASTAYEIIKY